MNALLVYRGERRFLSVELSAILAEGDSLAGTPTVEIVKKRGRAATTMVDNDPAPAVDETAVEFWLDVPDDQERGNYLAIVTCATTNGEVAVEEAPLIVQ